MKAWLPLAAAIFVGVFAAAWRIIAYRRRYGASAIAMLRGTERRERVREILNLIFPVLLFVQAVAWGIAPRTMSRLAWMPPQNLIGSIVIALGVAFIMQAQRDLGASWRIGIDHAARPGLVATGLYRFSRNPIFTGLIAVAAGFVLLMPTWLSLVVFIAGTLGVRRQVLEEEKYLVASYGDAYRSYAAQVGRFVPGIGRLR